MSGRNRFWASALTVAVGVMGAPLVAAPAQAALVGPSVLAAQALPGHTGLVPSVPRKDTPRISNGEIWDMEVVGNRVFIAGSFTSLANTIAPTATINQRYLASYNINTGF